MTNSFQEDTALTMITLEVVNKNENEKEIESWGKLHKGSKL
jgi:hypothetical protein